VYAFPNPCLAPARPTFHIESGVADRVEVRVYDLSGDLIHEAAIDGAPAIVNDGQGPQYAYELPWDVSGEGSGVYLFSVKAARSGSPDLKTVGRVAVVK